MAALLACLLKHTLPYLNLATVKASEATFSSSLSSMGDRINGLKSLYDNTDDDLLVLPHVQHFISQEKLVDRLLDGYISLLDGCTSAKDLVSQTKQDLQELLSSLRREDMNGTQCYLTSRRKSKKMIQKSLKDLRSFTSKQNVLSLEKDGETMALVCMLKEAESVTFTMIESLLSYVMGTKVQSRRSGWSLVSKLMHSKKVSDQSEDIDFKL